jgi:hypothetical protein
VSILRPTTVFSAHLIHLYSGRLLYFSPFWYVVQRKIWQPWIHAIHSGSITAAGSEFQAEQKDEDNYSILALTISIIYFRMTISSALTSK